MIWTCKHFNNGAAVGTLVVVLLLPLSLSLDDGEAVDNAVAAVVVPLAAVTSDSGGGGGGGH